MRIALLGGTGHVSRYLVGELLQAGHEIHLLTRKPVPTDERVQVFGGNALDADAVEAVLKNCELVINCVGQLKNAGSFYSAVTANILRAMALYGIRRYLLVTSSAVRLPTDKGLLGALGAAAFRVVFPRMVEDKAAEVEQVMSSGVDWTIFRLPLVLDGVSRKNPRIGSRLSGLFVSNSQVARAVVAEIASREHEHTSPFLFS